MSKRTVPEADGFYWEERRNGVLWSKGCHNGTTLDGKDASWQQIELCIALPLSVVDAALYGKDK